MCGWTLTIDKSSRPRRPLRPYHLESVQLRLPQVKHDKESLGEHHPRASTYERVTNIHDPYQTLRLSDTL